MNRRSVSLVRDPRRSGWEFTSEQHKGRRSRTDHLSIQRAATVRRLDTNVCLMRLKLRILSKRSQAEFFIVIGFSLNTVFKNTSTQKACSVNCIMFPRSGSDYYQISWKIYYTRVRKIVFPCFSKFHFVRISYVNLWKNSFEDVTKSPFLYRTSSTVESPLILYHSFTIASTILIHVFCLGQTSLVLC